MTEYKSRTGKHLLHFWIRNMEKTFVMFIGFAVLFGIYELLVIGEGSFQECLKQIPLFILGTGVMIVGVTAITNVRTFIPFAISFGSTRKEAFWGYQLSSIMMVIQIVLLYMIIQFALQGPKYVFTGSFFSGCLFYAGLMLVALGIGQIFAMVMSKMGAKGAAIFMVLMLVVIGFAIGLIFALIGNVNSVDLLNASWMMVVIAVCAGIVTNLIGSVLNYKSVMKAIVNQ